ncbi:hypothetical protein FXF51_02165 [Nonomuraea sp. PA05]|uniref:DUF6042 family protein n=1 Tax=Nonomuraea sp. PA05 TaxID=2604466 RepID=UPI0011D45699|nr:DUF6042 family protein [Nonomuraea sp. PA05]TYB71262.1 hypothetical protein FXF51_02165 [Nonomuraea sp. PA05]
MEIITVKDYWPEYGTIVVRDTWGEETVAEPELPLLGEHDLDAQPSGTIAKAGAGWLQASSRDGRHCVHLEAHDAPPPLDDGWDDVVETPYQARTGAVYLTSVMSSDLYVDIPLELGAPGLYRVRVACRHTPPEIPGFEASEGDLWRMQFWPTALEPPRWLARSRPAVRSASTGWRTCLGLPGQEVLSAVRLAAATGEATEDRIAAAYQPWSSGSGDWNSPIDDLSRFAAQLGVLAPATRRDLLPLLVAAGVLITETAGGVTRYRLAPDPPRAEEVLELPADEVAMIRQQDARQRHTSFAADLAALAVWSPVGAVTATPEELADRLLATAEDIRDTIRYGVECALLRIPANATFNAQPRSPQQPDVGRVATPEKRLEGSVFTSQRWKG